MTWEKLTLFACLASAWYMTGLIWIVQVVQYPLFDRVGPASFATYHAEYVRRVTWVVLAPMVVELVTSLALVVRRPAGVGPALAWVGLLLVGATWCSTIAWQVPLHDQLARGFEAGLHRRLIGSNALRTVAWTAHALVLLGMVARLHD